VKLLIAHRRCGGEEEAEPVLVQLTGSVVRLTLDDGEELEFDLGIHRKAR
jgi:hypothetical protein